MDEEVHSQKERRSRKGDGSDDDSDAEQAEEEDLNQSNDNEPDIEMNWNLAHYLPEAGACQTNFTVSFIVGSWPSG